MTGKSHFCNQTALLVSSDHGFVANGKWETSNWLLRMPDDVLARKDWCWVHLNQLLSTFVPQFPAGCAWFAQEHESKVWCCTKMSENVRKIWVQGMCHSAKNAWSWGGLQNHVLWTCSVMNMKFMMELTNSRKVLEHMNCRESQAHVEMTNTRGDDECTEMHGHACESNNGEDQSSHNICNSASSNVNTNSRLSECQCQFSDWAVRHDPNMRMRQFIQHCQLKSSSLIACNCCLLCHNFIQPPKMISLTQPNLSLMAPCKSFSCGVAWIILSRMQENTHPQPFL